MDQLQIAASMVGSFSPPYDTIVGEDLVEALKSDFAALKEARDKLKDLKDKSLNGQCRLHLNKRQGLYLSNTLSEQLASAGRSERAFISRQQHELGIFQAHVRLTIQDHLQSLSDESGRCLGRIIQKITLLDYYETKFSVWKATQERRKREGKKRQKTFCTESSQIKDLDRFFVHYHSTLEKLERGIGAYSEDGLQEKVYEEASRAPEPQPPRETSPLEERRERARRRRSGLSNSSAFDEESLSKARRARVPFQAGSYRRAAFYFGQ